MDLLACDKAYRDDGGKIRCKDSDGLICAHSYYCHLQSKYKQLPSAAFCPENPKMKKQVKA